MVRWWDEQVVPRLTDVSLRGHEVGDLRREVCEHLSGTVLEIGFGSGLNVRWYPQAVDEVRAVEPSGTGWTLSQRRRDRSRLPVRRVGLDGQRLDLPDDSADSALVTFSLCTIPDPALALREARRVVRPGGTLAVVEHGLSPDPGTAKRQRRWEPLQRRVAGGCHLTRDPLALLADNGWTVTWSERGALEGPAFAAPWTWVTQAVAVSDR